MNALVVVVVLVVVVAVVVVVAQRRRAARAREELDDARAEARRWIERLGGQVYALDAAGDAAARQALADAAERFTAAGGQVDRARTAAQARLAQQTAYEGLYYVRAARTALGLDPGPEVPALPGQQRAGAVTEDRQVDVDGHRYEASPQPSERTSHYYPGGVVAGRPVPGGWYSEPWWRTALVAGAWGVGSYLVASALFDGMTGFGDSWAYDAGYDAGMAQGAVDGAGYDGAGYDGSGYDGGAGDGGPGDQGAGWDGGGGDWTGGGGDWGGDPGGGDFGGGDFGGGDFGGGDFGGGNS
ncbi:DUF1542 domain-containing protein [Nakamurella endophytica]|uniref:DUF1542 domain-containing protein n=1 Tax=Nakamurella endophytica TaxID=1748367 RepID=A0A917WIT9_9ACTN|nr:DUF1542 domain-containing protein [Nakamurella endophytica]GGM07059.1 hypothetical protein GCM10011594_28840 [Nakamurella endophytica]